MKKIFFLTMLVPSVLWAQGDNQQRRVLIKEYAASVNQYVIIARGYPKPGLTEKLQIEGTAREAALLNAQILASQRFIESLNVIQHGSAKKYSQGNGYADVTYVITYPNIKRFLRKK